MSAASLGSVRVSRQVGFSAAHRYCQPRLSEEENRRLYGSLYSEHGHGHNFLLEAHVSGEIDPRTGMVINLKELDRLLKDVIAPLDHHHLNYDVDYFSDVVPTTENIARFCFEKLKEKLAGLPIHLCKVRLYEGPNLWVEYGGD